MRKLKVLVLMVLVSVSVWGQNNTFPEKGNASIYQSGTEARAYDVYNVDNKLVSRFEVTSDKTGQLWLKDANGNVKVMLKSNSTPSYIMGNLGVGTSSPNEKLEVNGNIKANRMALLNWYNPSYGHTNMALVFNGIRRNEEWTAFGDGARSTIGVINMDIFGNIRFISHRDDNFNGGKTISDEELINSNTKLIIKPGGEIGIGTKAPASKFDLVGDKGVMNKIHVKNASVGSNGGYFDINIGEHNSYAAGMKAYVPANQPGIDRVFLGLYTSTYDGGLKTRIERFTISDKGNVGIGTTNPDGTLHTKGGIAIQNPNLNYDTAGDAGERAGIIFGTNHSSNNSMFWISPDATNGNKLNIGTGYKYNDSGAKLTLLNDGRFGIGELNPSAKLDVAGNIKAQEIEVTLASIDNMQLNGTLAANNITLTTNGNTADFVFSDSYQLRDLSEVESFINTNKHLPEIPSAAQMEEQGVNLAEMNKLLLQKVEELTLYAIQQEAARKKEQGEREKLNAVLSQEQSARSEMEERLAKLEALLLKADQ